MRGVRRSLAWVPIVVIAVAGLAFASAADAKVFLTPEQALELAFPDCEVVRRTFYLDEVQMARAADLAGTEIPSAIVHSYRPSCEELSGGAAYFDTHRVRTLDETIMVVVDARARVRRVEILSFREPEDYIPVERWYQQFHGRPLDEELRLKKGIRTVTGATLTARATETAVRRVLALHGVISPEPVAEAPGASASGSGGSGR